jgi:hypothetical protein
MKSASELAAMIRKREVTSLAVVDAFINRINQVNKYINAVVADRFEDHARRLQRLIVFLTVVMFQTVCQKRMHLSLEFHLRQKIL